MDEFKFDELKNFEVPESWIENALKLTPEDKKPKRAGQYRYAAGIAACVVLAAAIGFSMIFGFNKNIKLTDPGSGTPGENIIAGSTVDTAGDSENPSVPSSFISDSTQNGTVVTEPAENSTGKVSKSNQKQQSTTQSNAKNKTAQAPTDGEKQTGTPENIKAETEPEEDTDTTKIQQKTYPPYVPPTTVVHHTYPPGVGGAGDEADDPTEDPLTVRGIHFSAVIPNKAEASGDIFCRIEDESGNTLGSGGSYDSSRLALKSVWNGSSIGLSYSPDFELYYDRTYQVYFYNSQGKVVYKIRNAYIERGQYYYL